MCQQCVAEGVLAQSTYEAIQAFLHEWPDAEWGPAHVALSDCNIEDGYLTGCIEDARRYPVEYSDHDPQEIAATIAFLEHLLTIPEDDR